MLENVQGLTLREDGNDYLSQSAILIKERVLSKLLPKATQNPPVVATPVVAVQVGGADALQANVLLTLQSSTRASLTFELPPPPIAHSLLQHLFETLSDILLKPLSKQ